ncbi:MAG: adenylosuccinate synthase [Candidatus Thorarchaeota archaeon]
MQNLVVVGLQWGDEGKGKLVDVLSKEFDIVARFQGGSNAGHTVKVGSETYKFRIMPTGAIRNKITVIGNGVVLDPQVLLEEIKNLESLGIDVNLFVSERAHVITPYHIELDELQENRKGDQKVGTTKRGIGPTYSDKISRVGVRVCDLLDSSETKQRDLSKESLERRITLLYDSSPESVFQDAVDALQEIFNKHNCKLGDSGEYLSNKLHSENKILFEGAQGTLLDIDHGTYPFVTSSNCISAAAAIGTGVSPVHIQDVLGICKAYTTRVGTGPFPTELNDSIGDKIRMQGNEFGTVTGRPRRCGWLDLVALRYAVRLNGAKYLAVTKLDVLNNIGSVKQCIAYKLDGREINSIPANPNIFSKVEPVYKEMEGWDTISNDGAVAFDNLPESVQSYLLQIEEFCEAKIAILSIGPDRNDTLVIEGTQFDCFKDV